MPVLRPKYNLNHAALQGDRYTVPAEQFSKLTSRRYPYPRVGTRAPNGMFPSRRGTPGLRPKYGLGGGGNPRVLKPKFTLDNTSIQGVMPASTYARLYGGELTTQPDIPTYTAEGPGLAVSYPPRSGRSIRRALGPARAPALQWEWETFFWGAVAGGIVALGFAYGIIPALGALTKKKIQKRS